MLRPRAVAVVGTSRSPGSIGHQILANLVTHGFTGAVYPINPGTTAVHSIRAYPSIHDVPDAVDLAVVAVPAERVLSVVEQCGTAGVRGLVIISAGFREIGPAGLEREKALLQAALQFDMRLVGPNCLGVLNTDPAISLNATFAPVVPPPGGVAFLSQSGALGLSILDYAKEYGIGISQFVSVGNKPDVSGNDLLEYWENDASVNAILMYVESFGNPLRFREIASRVSRKKPILALKSGRSKAGAGAASSHTGALAADDSAVDALLTQAGVLRAGSMEELFDMAMAFQGQPLPASAKTAVITNSGGPGILAADALEAARLELAQLQPETSARIRPLLPPEASVHNPLDMIATARPDAYRNALEALLRDEGVAAVLAIFVPPLGIRQEDVAEAIVAAASTCVQKPVLAVLMGREGLPQGRAELQHAGIPAYLFPESAARALSALNRYRAWLARPLAKPQQPAVDRARATEIVLQALGEGRQRLKPLEALELVSAYGIPVVQSGLAQTRDEAAALAREIGFPVVLKVTALEVVHKTDIGGVALDIRDEAAARGAFDRLTAAAHNANPQAAAAGVLVQQLASGGIETIAGLSRDAVFGPLIMFGLGGIFVEALHDVIFRLAPIDALEANEMVQGIRGASVLHGMRGQPPADQEALVDALCRLSQLAVDVPQIAELDLNPLVARAKGVLALDVRVTLHAS